MQILHWIFGVYLLITYSSLVNGSNSSPVNDDTKGSNASQPNDTYNDGSMSDMVHAMLTAKTYNKHIRPYATEGKIAEIAIDVYMQSISSVDDVHMSMTATFYLRMYWQDPRLKYNEDKPVILNYDLFDLLWVPDLFISNEKDGKFHEITVPNIFLKLWPNGTLLFSQRLTLTLSCFMKLKDYPFDNQSCPIYFESYGHTTDQVIFYWLETGGIAFNPNLILPEFKITNSDVDNCHKVFTTGEFTCIKATIHLQREMHYFLIQVYIPSILVVILSWINFWIDPRAAPARVSIGLITILTITTQSTGVSSRLPKVSYVKAIDIWMSVCLVFVFGAFLEYALVNVTLRSEEKEKERDRSHFLYVKDRNTSDTNSISTAKDSPSGSLHHEDFNIEILTNSKSEENSSKHCKTSCTSGKVANIDLISRAIFPVTFLIFNVLYWLIILHLIFNEIFEES